jgi:hypothetical protein
MKRQLVLLLTAVLALCTSLPAHEFHELHESPGPDETPYTHRVKAVFLHHFLRYLKWPDDYTAEPYNITFIGNSPIIPPLKQIAAKKTVNNRKIVIKEIQNIQDMDMDKCHILFICQPETESLKDILENAVRRHIVTVSDHDGFAKKGVAINFVMMEGRVTFEMNVKAIRKAGIYPSSQILKLAVLVGGEGGTKNDTH